MGLLLFQLSRVYLVVPADAFICYEKDDPHSGSSLLGHHHDHEADNAFEAALDTSGEGRNYVQHCKDTFDGVGLTPAQPFGPPTAVPQSGPESVAKSLPATSPSALENYLPPPFQPPKSIA